MLLSPRISVMYSNCRRYMPLHLRKGGSVATGVTLGNSMCRSIFLTYATGVTRSSTSPVLVVAKRDPGQICPVVGTELYDQGDSVFPPASRMRFVMRDSKKLASRRSSLRQDLGNLQDFMVWVDRYVTHRPLWAKAYLSIADEGIHIHRDSFYMEGFIFCVSHEIRGKGTCHSKKLSGPP